MFYEDKVTKMIAVDVREDEFDGELIAGYSDFATVEDARRVASAFIDGLKYERALS
jgi:hypothetical protein